MSTELMKLTETLPALVDADPEILSMLSEMMAEMTTPPQGIDDPNWRWRAMQVKISTATTTDPLMPGDAEEGDLWAHGETLWRRDGDGRKKPWKFIPFFSWTSRARFVQGDRSPKCTSPNAEMSHKGDLCVDCPHEPWKGGKRTSCSDAINFFVIAADMSGIYKLSFSGSSTGVGKMIRNSTRTKIWNKVYGLTTAEKSNATNKWQVYAASSLGSEKVPAEVKEFAKWAFEQTSAVQSAAVAALVDKRARVDAALYGDDANGDADGAALEAEMLGDENDGFSDSM